MRVLVVEDNARMAALLRRGLTEEGYSVDVVGDGLDAIELASKQPYDAVVLDVMLPGADGFEVCASMRRDGQWAPVLMLTARDELDWRVRGLNAGADDYVIKPFAFAELTARLRAMLRRGTPDREPVLSHGAVRADPAARRDWNNGVEVILAPTQFDLLSLFLRSPAEVLTRGPSWPRCGTSRTTPGATWSSSTWRCCAGACRRSPSGTTSIPSAASVTG